jgi:hypothetical protein
MRRFSFAIVTMSLGVALVGVAAPESACAQAAAAR